MLEDGQERAYSTKAHVYKSDKIGMRGARCVDFGVEIASDMAEIQTESTKMR